MKLISFAALSLLAVTVSAYPVPGTPPQDTGAQSALQHQSTDTPSTLQHQSTTTPSTLQHQSTDAQEPQQDQEKELKDELKKLKQQYVDQKTLVGGLKALINAMKKEQLELQESADALGENDPNKAEMMMRLSSQFFDIQEARDSLDAARQGLNSAQDQCEILEAKLASLNDF
ncbi:hypothetical protein BASA50_001294 [Batrachochytrium salamandrivorans]|uniref:Uncharacterized protein n=1 Tax=Batrachochytrium salamandrivorans TaxID=1357716 RepID=A0ABQ8EYS9_9FUNG|nr:hypothetical protein BASA60_001895 [Batrachochytrium salamandrivorans]KAH6587365.1 hypothetical protein BASA50_001294 [Batrachochytrium salamandrivorans]KAH9267316.1 hypothetical protein BASA83_010050 [Batrachochytrium salamandrivorans]